MDPVSTRRAKALWRGRVTAVLIAVTAQFEELVRILTMRLLLDPAALLLPRRVALVLADAAALTLLLLPYSGVGVYWEMRSAFGSGRAGSIRLAWHWLARPYRDYVAMRRLAFGRQSANDLNIVERNADRVEPLRAAGESYVVVTVHGCREAYAATRNRAVTPGHIVQVGLDPRGTIRSLHDLRIRIQYGTMVHTLRSVWNRSVDFVAIGVDPLPAKTILQRLRQPGNVVMMDIDAIREEYETNTFERPFAGEAKRRFSTGAARLAAMSGCSIIPCRCAVESDGTLEIRWGEAIHEIGDVEAVMNRILDFLEVGVGERPTQYVRRIGGKRRWDPHVHHWGGPGAVSS